MFTWSPRARSLVVVLGTASAVLALGVATPLGAGAQIDDLLGSTTTTADSGGEPTTTTAAPAPTTSSTSSTSSTTTTTRAAVPAVPESTTTTTAPPRREPPPPPPGGGDNTEPLPEDGYAGFPPDLQALTDSIARSGPSSSRPLLDALAPLVELGYSEEEIALLGFGRFPVAGHATYVHDWWFPRFGPHWRLHQGTDVFAPHGTPVRAPVDGHIRITNGGLGGLAVYVVQPDSTYYYLAHLAGLAEGLHEGQVVRTGEVVGYVGDSGNAAGGRPHLHIQIHPYGGAPIDPKPVLDQFLDQAIARAPDLVAAYEARAARRDAPETVATPARTVQDPGRIRAPYAALLWASSANPGGGALPLVSAAAARVADRIDWAGRVADEHARFVARTFADQRAREMLVPLVPPGLAAVMP